MVASVVCLPSIVRQHLQKTSSLKLLGQFQLNFICSLQAIGERKFFIFGPGHITKMPMPIHGNNPKKSSPEPLGQLP